MRNAARRVTRLHLAKSGLGAPGRNAGACLQTRHLATAVDVTPRQASNSPGTNSRIELRTSPSTMMSALVQNLQALENVHQKDEQGTSADPEGLSSASEINPGDYVELRSHLMVDDAIVLGTPKSTGLNDSFVTFLSTGEVYVSRKRSGLIVIPKIFDSEVALKAGADDHSAQVQLMKDMRVFRKKIDKALYNIRLVAQVHLYKQFRAAEADVWSTVTLQEAVSFIGSRLSPKQKEEMAQGLLTLAVHKYLMEETDHFSLTSKDDIFHVVPQEYIRNCREVTRWLDRMDPRLTDFVTKARGIIKFSDYLEKDSIAESDIVPVPNPHFTFTVNDHEILHFIRRSLSRQRLLQPSPYEKVLSYLGLVLGRPYDGSQDLPFILLKQLGASPLGGDVRAENQYLTPWTKGREEQLEKEGSRLLEHHIAGQPPTESSRARLPVYGDGVDHVRHDWGDLQVHVIDDILAEELDDGISIEEAGDGSYWLHVHIADPTALLRPHSALAQAAEERGTTLYLSDGTYPMLPKSLANSFSLSSAAGPDNSPMPVMTFSAKIDKQGRLVDYNARPAFVRNIKTLQYDQVDSILGIQRPTSQFWQDTRLPENSGESGGVNAITASDVAILKRLMAVAGISERHRIQSGACVTGWSNAGNVSMEPRHVPVPPFPPTVPIHYRGFPSVTVQPPVEFSVKTGGGSRSIVGEIMGIACRAAGSVARDRGIPVIFRYTKIENLEALGSSRDPETGSVTPGPEFRQLLHRSGLSSSPATIDWLGVKEPYSRVTSPLRRYGDLINHWQLKASIGGQDPPFASDTLESMMNDMAWKEKHHKRVAADEDEFWSMAGLRRMLDAGKFDRSQVRGLRALVLGEPKIDRERGRMEFRRSIMLPQLGMSGVLRGLTPEQSAELEFGAVVSVDLEQVTDGRQPTIECLFPH
ncbi:hypothetical protein FRB95_007830 [Tulasnella sp. JGI-2019a]|nr:hypothetical protein FRB95_007830 [Tulasnella sp. JGI-2019a]